MAVGERTFNRATHAWGQNAAGVGDASFFEQPDGLIDHEGREGGRNFERLGIGCALLLVDDQGLAAHFDDQGLSDRQHHLWCRNRKKDLAHALKVEAGAAERHSRMHSQRNRALRRCRPEHRVPVVRAGVGNELSIAPKVSFADRTHGALKFIVGNGEQHEFGTRQQFAQLERIEAGLTLFAGEPETKLEYLAVVDSQLFKPVNDKFKGQALAIVAAQVGGVRLIDNQIIEIREQDA